MNFKNSSKSYTL